jgi:hypothetical protein
MISSSGKAVLAQESVPGNITLSSATVNGQLTVNDAAVIGGEDTLNFQIQGVPAPLPAFHILFGSCTVGQCGPFTDMSGDGSAITGLYADTQEVFGTTNLIFPLAVDFTLNAGEDLAIKLIFENYASGAMVLGDTTSGQVYRECRDSVSTGVLVVGSLNTVNAPIPAFAIANCQQIVQPSGTCTRTGVSSGTDSNECFATVLDSTLLGTTGTVSLGDTPGVCPIELTTSGLIPSMQYPEGTTTLTDTVFELGSGNQIQCTTSLNVIDNQAPQVICPQSQTADPRFCQGVAPPFGVIENCPNPFISESFASVGAPPPTFPEPGTYTVTILADDFSTPSVTCSYVLTVPNAFTFPNCPVAPVLEDNDNQKCSAFINVEDLVGAEDPACSGAVYTNYDPAGYDYPVGTTEFVAVSHAGMDVTNTCIFDIVVTDTQVPQIFCPPDIVVPQTEAGGARVLYPDPEIIDNCPSDVVISNNGFNSGDLFSVGDTTVTLTAGDDAGTTSCTFQVRVAAVEPGETPSQTPVNLPTITNTNTPTRTDFVSPQVSRDPVSPSFSSSDSRSPNPSISPSSSPFVIPPSDSPSPTGTPTPSRSSSPSSSPSGSPSPSESVIPPSDTPSPYIPSASATLTPLLEVVPFVQMGNSVMVEVLLPCRTSTCTLAEAEFYVNEFTIALDVSLSEVEFVNLHGNEVTFIVCDSVDTADLANQINAGTATGFEGVFVESMNFNAECDQTLRANQAFAAQVESSSAAVFFAGLLSVLSLLLL